MADSDSSISTIGSFAQDLAQSLRDSSVNDQNVLSSIHPPPSNSTVPSLLTHLSTTLNAASLNPEATIIDFILDKATDTPSHGGLGISAAAAATPSQYAEVLFLVSAHLTSLHNRSKSRSYLRTLPSALANTIPMTLTQKIFAQHALSPIPSTGLPISAVLRVGVDWILASELSWAEMARTHASLGSPGIWRNDRFWLAGDHIVHPDVMHIPRVQKMKETAERAKQDFRMTEYQGMNYTIMHTEFVRERAEPGMLCVGSDSHTCSAGAVGCLSIGMGSADVMMTLALGETWFKVPESVKIEFVGKPRVGVSGKDVILHVLGQLKRNTVASERIVEFMGEGCKYLSVDSRFAICNMCTEFGAVTGVFVPDEITMKYVQGRRRKMNKLNSVYFRPDDGAKYASEHVINLAEVENTIAVYPEPDHVVPVSEKSGQKLDGVFIGACTTTEEELVLAALVLKVGLAKKLPLAKGKRHYVPGSLPIVDKLKELGLLDVYEAAGFTRGPPGCSYCVGLSAEKAEKGETWLSSQNRNFKNRMGTGSFGNLSSAVVCAASAFSLTITDPAPFIAELDLDFYESRYRNTSVPSLAALSYTEPDLSSYKLHTTTPSTSTSTISNPSPSQSAYPLIKSNIIPLGNLIDTDALAPGYTLGTCHTPADFGRHCLEQTHPTFRSRIQSGPFDGSAVVVAGSAFGVGSSREGAVAALIGSGVRCVIAKSFAFIFGRNMPSLGLLGFVIPEDSDFWEYGWDEGEGGAAEERAIEVDVDKRMVRVLVEGEWREWDFQLSELEWRLTRNEGVSQAFGRFGTGIWEGMMKNGQEEGEEGMGRKQVESLTEGENQVQKEIAW